MTTSINERTHFFIKIYLSHFILEMVDFGCVWEVSWRRGQTATYWPKVLLTIEALLPHLGWGCSTVGHWGPHAVSLQADSHAGILSPNWLQLQLELTQAVCGTWLYIVSHSPVSAVPPLIYTGASLNWQLGRGSIYNIQFEWQEHFYFKLFSLVNKVEYSQALLCITTNSIEHQ